MVGVTSRSAVWHDVELGAYDADLPLWLELAAAANGPILDLGAGTGRVAAHLAAHGHELVALDMDPDLLAVLAQRAPGVTTVRADARSFSLERRFPLVIAPMQLAHIVGGRAGRAAMLERVHAHLTGGGTFAAALTDPMEALEDRGDPFPLPDILERDGWVFSSQPLSVREDNCSVAMERRRQAVSPTGEIDVETVTIALDVFSSEQFEDEVRVAGLEPVGRRPVPESPDHIGSTVVLCRR
jgi:trans-aconitate methyltransferase